jgi:hypothetical protein
MLALYTMNYLDHTLENIPLARACYGQKTDLSSYPGRSNWSQSISHHGTPHNQLRAREFGVIRVIDAGYSSDADYFIRCCCETVTMYSGVRVTPGSAVGRRTLQSSGIELHMIIYAIFYVGFNVRLTLRCNSLVHNCPLQKFPRPVVTFGSSVK